MKNEITKKYLLIGICVIFSIVIFVKSSLDKNEIYNHGIFFIGQLYKINDGGKNSNTSCFHYYIKGRRYEFSYRDGGVSDSLRMFQVLLDDPNKAVILDDSVPSYLHFSDVPAEGWKDRPVCR